MAIKLEIEQGSPAWLEMKYTHIGASYAPIINGDSPYCTPRQLWQSMITHTPFQSHPGMERGKRLEIECREKWSKDTTLSFETPVFQSTEMPWMIYSADGYCNNNHSYPVLIEIKCLSKEKHQHFLETLEIPNEYIAQLAHALFVSGLGVIYYVSYNPDFPENDKLVSIGVLRDDVFLAQYLPKVHNFYQCLQTLEPPDLIDRDYREATPKWNVLANEYVEVVEQYAAITAKKEELRSQLILESKYQNMRSSNLQISSHLQQGKIQYANIPELAAVDLDKFREEPKTVFRLTLR